MIEEVCLGQFSWLYTHETTPCRKSRCEMKKEMLEKFQSEHAAQQSLTDLFHVRLQVTL